MKRKPPDKLIGLQSLPFMDHRKNGDYMHAVNERDSGEIGTMVWIPDKRGGAIGSLAYYNSRGNLMGYQRMQVIMPKKKGRK